MATMTRLKRLNRAVKQRIITVLMEGLVAELAEEATDTGIPLDLLPAPTLDTFELAQTPDVGSRIECKRLIINIAHDRGTVYEPKLSGNGTYASRIANMRVTMSIFYALPCNISGVTTYGRTPTAQELAETIVDIYRGCITAALQRLGPDGVSILEFEPYEDDYIDSIIDADNGTVIGRAEVEFHIKAQGEHYQPDYSLE